MTPLRLAIVGVGDVARRHYLPEASRLDSNAQIVLACGRTEDRVRRVAAEFGIPRWTTDLEEALDSDIDVVVNLTQADAHLAVTQAALERGRHVFSEKPLAVTPGEARRLRDEAARHGVTLACAPAVMVFPQVQHVQQLIASGELGIIRSARMQALGGVPPWRGYESDPSLYFSDDVGPLVDIGIYHLHAFTGLVGRVRRVGAISRRTRDSFVIADGPLEGKTVTIEGDDHWQLLLETSDCTASLEASFATAASAALECELRGDNGSVAFSILDNRAPVRVLRCGADAWIDVEITQARPSADLMLGVLHLVDCLSGEAALLTSAEQAVHVIDVLAAAREASATGQTVHLMRGP